MPDARRNSECTKYKDLAKGFARYWVQIASNGNHSRLAFDQPNTWSQKYNLVWDKILGLNVFPAAVAEAEVAHYKVTMQPYGIPLDSRTHITKSDWATWSAALSNNQADFEALVNPMYAYLDNTTARQPFADEYATDDINNDGMHARPVIGGVFIQMLADPAILKNGPARIGSRSPAGRRSPRPRKSLTSSLPRRPKRRHGTM